MTERMHLTDANKAIARRLFDEILNAHNLARSDQLYARNYVPHSLPPGFSADREGTKQFLSHISGPFPTCTLRLRI
jgi:predicted SnoaL-like aldol condensation-catalyzing enzyme